MQVNVTARSDFVFRVIQISMKWWLFKLLPYRKIIMNLYAAMQMSLTGWLYFTNTSANGRCSFERNAVRTHLCAMLGLVS
jgi:hypothetical protein